MKTAILLAAYNSAAYLGQMLNSLLAQSEQDFTVYLHDDGSGDETMEIVERYCGRHPDRFVVVPDGEHRGAKESFFYLMEKVDADLYFFADADDVWLPEKVERLRETMVRTMEEASGEGALPVAVFCDMYVTDESLEITSNSFVTSIGRDGNRLKYQQILIDNPAAGCSMCINRTLRDMAIRPGVCRENIPMHDQWLLVLAAAMGRAVFVPEPLVYYRQHGDNEMGADSETVCEKLSRNARDFVSGEFLRNKKKFLMQARRLARELLRYPELSADKRRVIRAFCRINRKYKLERMKFYRDNHFTRARGSRWMRLWV